MFSSTSVGGAEQGPRPRVLLPAWHHLIALLALTANRFGSCGIVKSHAPEGWEKRPAKKAQKHKDARANSLLIVRPRDD